MKQMQIIKNFGRHLGYFTLGAVPVALHSRNGLLTHPNNALVVFQIFFSLFLPKCSTIFVPFGHNTRNIPFSHPGVKHEISCFITSSVEADDLFSGKGFENVKIISQFVWALNAVSKVVTRCLRMTTVWQPHR